MVVGLNRCSPFSIIRLLIESCKSLETFLANLFIHYKIQIHYKSAQPWRWLKCINIKSRSEDCMWAFDISSHFHLGTRSGLSVSARFWCSGLTCWQFRHYSTYLAMSVFILFHQYDPLRSLYILVLSRYNTVYRDRRASSIISFLSFPLVGTHSCSKWVNTPSIAKWKYEPFPASSCCLIF